MRKARKEKSSVFERIVDWGINFLDRVDQPSTPRHLRPERADATIARVRQVYGTSCGVAVTAMFARQSHDVVMSFMFPKPKRSYATSYEDVWRALSHFGVIHKKQVRKFVSWETIPSHALVEASANIVPEGGAFHWLIFQRLSKDRFRLIDPNAGADTLTDVNLSEWDGISYSLVTPRTREEGPLKLSAPPVRPKAPPKKKHRARAKRKAS